jgi:hypothetical protein
MPVSGSAVMLDGVAAGLARGDAGLGEAAHHFRRVFEHDEVELDRLPGRHVAELARGVHLGAVGDGVELAGRERAVGHLDAHHLAVGLALAVGRAEGTGPRPPRRGQRLRSKLSISALTMGSFDLSGELGTRVQVTEEASGHIAANRAQHYRRGAGGQGAG